MKKQVKGNGKSKNYYFDQTVEDAIVLYNNTTDDNERNEIYRTHIQHAFEKLVENIIHTFGFYYFDVPPEEVKHEVVSFLVLNIHKYKHDKGKAFSYFSIVAKNYLILHNNTNYKNYKLHDSIDTLDFGHSIPVTDSIFNEISRPHDNIMVTNSHTIISEFVEQMIQYWDNNMTKIFRRRKDLLVADSVLSLFKSRHDIENFNKKYLYVLLREKTGSNTPHITRIITVMKSINKKLQHEFNNKGCINTNPTGSFLT